MTADSNTTRRYITKHRGGRYRRIACLSDGNFKGKTKLRRHRVSHKKSHDSHHGVSDVITSIK